MAESKLCRRFSKLMRRLPIPGEAAALWVGGSMGVPGEAVVVVLVCFGALHAGDPHEERRELAAGRGGVAGVCGGTCTMVPCAPGHVLGFVL